MYEPHMHALLGYRNWLSSMSIEKIPTVPFCPACRPAWFAADCQFQISLEFVSPYRLLRPDMTYISWLLYQTPGISAPLQCSLRLRHVKFCRLFCIIPPHILNVVFHPQSSRMVRSCLHACRGWQFAPRIMCPLLASRAWKAKLIWQKTPWSV